MWIRLLGTAGLIIGLAGCAAQPPSPRPVTDITPQQAVEKDSVGVQVRWGGPILSVELKPDETCFWMLSFFLGGDGEPHLQNQPQGRFLACAMGYYDPVVYAAGRTMTVVGAVGPTATVTAGNVKHRVATVNVQAVYLWPGWPVRAVVIYPGPWYGPCCAPYGPYAPGYPYGGPYPYPFAP